MTFHTYLTFLGAAAVLLLMPGPTNLLIVGQALAHGARSIWPLTWAVTVSDAILMAIAGTGIGLILAASHELFVVTKFLGGGYLLALGIKELATTTGHLEMQATTTKRASRSLFHQALIVNTLNPKGIIFFVAFLPHFASPKAPFAPQYLMLMAGFLVLSVINSALHGVLADRFHHLFQGQRAARLLQIAGGLALIAAAVIVVLMHEPTSPTTSAG